MSEERQRDKKGKKERDKKDDIEGEEEEVRIK